MRYYTDEPIENVYPAEFREIEDKVTEVETKPEQRLTSKQKHFSKKEKEQKHLNHESTRIELPYEAEKPKKKYKTIYALFVIQGYGTKLNEKNEMVPVEPNAEVKAISMEEHETFRDVVSQYEQFSGGVFIKDAFYPFKTKGEVTRVTELSKEDIIKIANIK